LSRTETAITTIAHQSGDALWGIAQQLGDASRWPEIFERNREVISNPDRIFPDQVLILPI
jgi:nucleoid-associated protein YgaU